MRNNVLVVVAICFFGHVQAAENEQTGLIGINANGVEFHRFAHEMTVVGIAKSAIPNTTLLIQNMRGNTYAKDCVLLIRGKIETQKDINELKPESVLQMSCTPEVVKVKQPE